MPAFSVSVSPMPGEHQRRGGSQPPWRRSAQRAILPWAYSLGLLGFQASPVPRVGAGAVASHARSGKRARCSPAAPHPERRIELHAQLQARAAHGNRPRKRTRSAAPIAPSDRIAARPVEPGSHSPPEICGIKRSVDRGGLHRAGQPGQARRTQQRPDSMLAVVLIPMRYADCSLRPMALSLSPHRLSRSRTKTTPMATTAKSKVTRLARLLPSRGIQAASGKGSVPLMVAPSGGFQGPKMR